ncbi:MAG: hypothetical protein IKE00_04375 [Oscillospiraceae bacterium]|nr:hypothetical protein [Oscillospiraceae bacterium]
MATTTTVTVRAKADYPYHYECLYCGRENNKTLHLEAAKVQDVNGSRKTRVADNNDAARQMESQLMSGFDQVVRANEKEVETFREYWSSCQNGEPGRKPVRISKREPDSFTCSYCGREQPYSKSFGKSGTGFALLIVLGGFAALCALIFLILSFAMSAQPYRGLFIGFGTAAVLSLPIGIPGVRRADEAEAALQWEELKEISYAPEKLPRYEHKS